MKIAFVIMGPNQTFLGARLDETEANIFADENNAEVIQSRYEPTETGFKLLDIEINDGRIIQ